MEISALQKARYEYAPKLPGMLRHGIADICVKEGEETQSVADQEKIKALFPNTYGKKEITFQKGANTSVAKKQVVGVILSGGRIRICEIDGLTANFSGEAPTLVVYNQDKPGCIVKVTSRLGEAGINIATMQVYRDERGGHAVMVIEVDQEVPRERIAALEQEEGIEKVIYLCLEE